MIRRISTKLVLAVLTAVVLPFVVFAFYVSEQMGEKLTRHVVEQALLGLAKDLANQLDSFVLERRQDVLQWADQPLTKLAGEELLEERASSPGGGSDWNAQTLAQWSSGRGGLDAADRARFLHRAQLTREFDRYVDLKGVYDVLLLVSRDGRLVTCSTRHPAGTLFDPAYIESLFDRDYRQESWFQRVVETGDEVQVDKYRSPFRIPEVHEPADPAWDYQLAFAAPVHDDVMPQRVDGVLFAVVNWYFVQQIASSSVVRDAFRGLVRDAEEPSPYAWIWAADADTILGHPNRALYGKSVSRDVRLPQMTRAVLESASGFGLYPEYEFEGEKKNAAFRRCAGPEAGGFGWVVGVGIDNDDIYSTAYELRNLILGGTAAVLVMAVLGTFLIARRMTDPILEIQRCAGRVAEGDLGARVTIRSSDELGALAADMNRMIEKLAEQQQALVQAGKDAAWREMARQVAHDLKNPLTPIRLSIELLERARRERPSEFERILERTMDLVRRQVSHLEEIAAEFYEFTGEGRLTLEEVDLREMLREVLHLHDAWAVELGVEVQLDGDGGTVIGDRNKLQRVFVNLVSNALQAMEEGGTLSVLVQPEGEGVTVSVADTGCGLAREAREHLFEPHFTTKSEGTGLGLAISRQVVEHLGGTIELLERPGERGVVARVWLRRDGPPAPEASR